MFFLLPPCSPFVRKMLLGKRRLVLFLRHFDSLGTLTTVSRAAKGGLGMGFGMRIVTLFFFFFFFFLSRSMMRANSTRR